MTWVITIIGGAYIVYRAVGAAVTSHFRRIKRDQAEIAAWKPLMHGEPSRNVEASRWATPHDDVDGAS